MKYIVLIYMVVMSIAAFIAFGLDKYKAKTNRWRIRERTLFSLALAGGGIGGKGPLRSAAGRASVRKADSPGLGAGEPHAGMGGRLRKRDGGGRLPGKHP